MREVAFLGAMGGLVVALTLLWTALEKLRTLLNRAVPLSSAEVASGAVEMVVAVALFVRPESRISQALAVAVCTALVFVNLAIRIKQPCACLGARSLGLARARLRMFVSLLGGCALASVWAAEAYGLVWSDGLRQRGVAATVVLVGAVAVLWACASVHGKPFAPAARGLNRSLDLRSTAAWANVSRFVDLPIDAQTMVEFRSDEYVYYASSGTCGGAPCTALFVMADSMPVGAGVVSADGLVVTSSGDGDLVAGAPHRLALAGAAS